MLMCATPHCVTKDNISKTRVVCYWWYQVSIIQSSSLQASNLSAEVWMGTEGIHEK